MLPVFLYCKKVSVIKCAFVAVTMVLFVRKNLTGTAAVTEFLLVAGGAGAVSACFTVVVEGAGVWVFALPGIAGHIITLLFPAFIIDLLGWRFKRA